MLRAVSVLALAAIALCACKPPPGKGEQASTSGAPVAVSSAPAPAPAPPQPAHNWAYRQGDAYAYASQDPNDGAPTLIRFLGEQDGVYTIIESEGGAVVAASCAKPCATVRLRGKGMDQTLPLSQTSTVYAALTDAMNGQMDVYKPPAANARRTTAPPQ